MPIHYREVQEQVIRAGVQAGERQMLLMQHRQQAKALLQQYSTDLDYLRTLVETVSVVNPRLRCAVPRQENMAGSFAPPQNLLPHVILAADGSQINPSRHDPVAFGLVNVGVFRMENGSTQAPRQFIRSQLIVPDPLDADAWNLNEQTVALLRDLSERRILAEIASGETKPVIALTDGPLEMFRDPQEGKFFDDSFHEYLESLARISLQDGIAAGYVVKPGSDQTVRLLELTLLSPDEYKQAGKPHHLAGVIDADLFSRLLAPGERSAVFTLHSTSSALYRSIDDKLELCFFYLHTGTIEAPSLARVEIPIWVAENSAMVDLLHAVLINQCRILGNKPYPYALHRSHEIALVRQEEKDQVLGMLVRELNRQKVEIAEKSSKQAVKDATKT